MHVIVTSYRRPKYLKPTLESLRLDRSHKIFVADGGSDAATLAIIRNLADGHLVLEGNPGADVLKNMGITEWGKGQQRVMITSDDLVYPPGAVSWALEQYSRLNRGKAKWTFCACNMDYIDKAPPRPFVSLNGVDLLEVDTCQVSGAILEIDVWKKVGGFPVYGRSGQGDWAISRRLRQLGYRMGYFRRPCLVHLGAAKWSDYPDYSADFERDSSLFQAAAKKDLQRGAM